MKSRRCLASLFAFIAAGAIAACGGGGAGAPPSASVDSPAPAPPRSADLSGLNALQTAVKRLELEPSYRATVVSDTEGGDKIQGSFEFVAPDRYHLSIEGGIPLEVITIGRNSYVKSGGTWQQADPTFLPFSPDDVMTELETIAAGEAAPGAEQGMAGSKCQVYTIARPAGAAQFCIEPEGPLVSASYKDGATTVTVSFSDFGGGIEIKAPL